MEWKFVNRRATLFVANPFNITGDILPLYISEFSKMNLLPSVNKGIGFKITPQGIEQEEVLSLDLKYLDNTLKVNFGPDRADIESTKQGETWESFHTIVDKIIKILSSQMNHRVVRLALCGSIIYSMDEEKSMQIYSKLAKIKNEQPVEWQLRKVLRNNLTTDDGTKNVIVNNVYSLTNTILIPGVTLRKGVLLDMDINTLVGTSPDNVMAIQEKFWKHASSVIDEAVVHYQTVFEDADLAMINHKVEEFYMVLLDPAGIEAKYKWALAFSPQPGDTHYSQAKDEHTNFVVESFWELGYLSEYIHDLLNDPRNYRYYDVITLRQMCYDAAKERRITKSDVKDTNWKKVIKELEKEQGEIEHFWD